MNNSLVMHFRHVIWPTGTTFTIEEYVEKPGSKQDYVILRLLNSNKLVITYARDFLRLINNMTESKEILGVTLAGRGIEGKTSLPEEFTIVTSEPYYRDGTLMFPYEAYTGYNTFKYNPTTNNYVRMIESQIKEDNVLPPRQVYTVNPKF